jgi:hypothetical protein
MTMQALADQVAAEIRAAIPAAAEVGFQAHKRRHAIIGDRANVGPIVQDVLSEKPKGFIELPIPASAPGAIGRCDGVVTRVIRDYDFSADEYVTRIDVAFT